MDDDEVNRSINRAGQITAVVYLPTGDSPQFWEQLGRTVATYGFLEEVLGKAIFAFTATRNYEPRRNRRGLIKHGFRSLSGH